MADKEDPGYTDYLMNPKLTVEYVRSESQHQAHNPMPLTYSDEDKAKTNSKASKKEDKQREVRLKDFDKQLFNKEEHIQIHQAIKKDPKLPRKPVGAKTILKENQKLRSENEKLHAMCLELTSMIKQLNKTPTPQTETKSSLHKAKPQPQDKPKKKYSKPSEEPRSTNSKQERATGSATEAKIKTRQEEKSLDIRNFQVKCLVNEDLEQYERDNRHRYVPKDLSKKNLTLGAKIDKDIRWTLLMQRVSPEGERAVPQPHRDRPKPKSQLQNALQTRPPCRRQVEACQPRALGVRLGLA